MTLQELGAVRRALDAGELDERLAQLRYGENGKGPGESQKRARGVSSAASARMIRGPWRSALLLDVRRSAVTTPITSTAGLAGAVDVDFLACCAPNGSTG